jgi:tetratricopeptide (TPR) repeat protein
MLTAAKSFFLSPFLGLAVLLFCCAAFSEKVLIYDEEKGIMLVDKDNPQTSSALKKETNTPKNAERLHTLSDGKTVDATIQRGRQKDPPSVYFESGLQYFKNGNFDDALRNFTRADSLDPQPKYILWMGKALRQMGKYQQQIFMMQRIITTYPESDVADDALFEIAFSYQANDDYDRAEKTYSRLAEQYPFGTSFSNGENFRDIAHKQVQMMRAEMASTLKILGFTGNDEEALYAAFQKEKGLPVTGAGTPATVKAIKAAHGKFLEAEAARARRQERVGKYRTMAFVLCGLLAANALGLLVMQRNIMAKRKHLAALYQTLSDLNTGAL